MYQTPQPIPAPPVDRRREGRSDRGKLRFRLELIFAIGLAIAVGAGLVVAGRTGRFGWTLVLTAGILGAVLAARFSRGPKADVDEPAEDMADNPWAHEVSGRRRLTAGTLEYEIERARRHQRPLSVLAIVPDELELLAAGAGDSLPKLLDLSSASEAAVRAMDIVERIGPSRVRVALPDTGPEGGRIVAERIRLRIDATRPELEPGRVVGVSVSIGISTYPADGTDTVELEAAAERALARAQELGGNRTVLFSVPAGEPRGWGLRSTSAAGTTPPLPQR